MLNPGDPAHLILLALAIALLILIDRKVRALQDRRLRYCAWCGKAYRRSELRPGSHPDYCDRPECEASDN